MESAESKRQRRTPHVVRTALEDIRDECHSSREIWKRLIKLAERNMDIQQAFELARLRDHIGAIDRLASDALRGEYRDE